jgi:hypothetical protein
MDHTSGKNSTAPAPTTEGGPQQPAYEPPAVAWEEAFEPVAASRCALYPDEAGCFVGTPEV